jgi:hypothetical protein
MARFAKTVLATAMLGAGMSALVPGAAIAQERGGDEQTGLSNVNDTQTIVPVNACNNNVPVNVLGVQVPIQDVAGTIPVLSPAEKGSEQAAGIAKNCENEVAAEND